MKIDIPRIVRADNDLLFDDQGRSYIDLFSGNGAVWLGHGNPRIVEQVSRQLEQVWIAPGFEHLSVTAARSAVNDFFPTTHELVALYSTGMEASEFAIRFARVATGRLGVVGFENSMHGKSLAAAYLGWDNGDGVRLPDFARVSLRDGEGAALETLEKLLRGESVAAVFVEPIHGSGGGEMVSRAFLSALARMCSESGTLLVFDEILTGFHRTGSPFCFSRLDFVPDLVLIGKALGNGFPVSGVVAERSRPVQSEMLPGSTYAGNPLAGAAAAATLQELRRADVPSRVEAIEQIIRKSFDSLEASFAVRGRGALWVVTLPEHVVPLDVVVRAHRRGVSVGHAGRHVRVLPAASIEADHLEKACGILVEEMIGRG